MHSIHKHKDILLIQSKRFDTKTKLQTACYTLNAHNTLNAHSIHSMCTQYTQCFTLNGPEGGIGEEEKNQREQQWGKAPLSEGGATRREGEKGEGEREDASGKGWKLGAEVRERKKERREGVRECGRGKRHERVGPIREWVRPFVFDGRMAATWSGGAPCPKRIPNPGHWSASGPSTVHKPRKWVSFSHLSQTIIEDTQ
jgi:hypothetical protein